DQPVGEPVERLAQARRAFERAHDPQREPPRQLEEHVVEGGEVRVEARPRDARRAGDAGDAGALEAPAAELGERGLEEPLPRRRPLPLARADAHEGRARRQRSGTHAPASKVIGMRATPFTSVEDSGSTGPASSKPGPRAISSSNITRA